MKYKVVMEIEDTGDLANASHICNDIMQILEDHYEVNKIDVEVIEE